MTDGLDHRDWFIAGLIRKYVVNFGVDIIQLFGPMAVVEMMQLTIKTDET